MESSLEVDDYRKVTHDVNDNDIDPDSDNDLGCLGHVSSCMQRQEAWEAAVEGGRVGGGGGRGEGGEGGGRDRACSNRTLPPGGGCSPA